MRFAILVGLLLVLTLGCGSKAPPPVVEEKNVQNAAPADTTDSDRQKLLKNLKSSNSRRAAAEELSGWVDSDPEAVAGLIELLKDKSTTGLGKILPTQINSTREAAVRALLWGGAKGETALRDKGFAALREGLADPQSAIREHTAYTIGLLGPLGRPLSADVQKLCTSSDEKVRGAAFDALASIGVTDVAGYAALLNNENRDIGQLAAQQAATFTDIPDAAIVPLATAVAGNDPTISRGAASGLATAGPRAASAAPAVIAAIRKNYPEEIPQSPMPEGSEQVYWRALARIGPAAVLPTAELLGHKNPMVRGLAAKTLGEIGPAAQPAGEKLKSALNDQFGNVAIEAAVALTRVGAGTDAALTVMKRAIEAENDVALSAISAIPRMGDPGKPLVPLALGKLGSAVPFARLGAVGLVGTLPPAEAVKYVADLGKLTSDAYAPIRLQTAMVLEKLGPAAAPAGAALGEALAKEMEDQVRDQDIEALLAMGVGAKPALPALLPLLVDKSMMLNRRTRVIAAVATADPSSKEVLTALLAIAVDETTEIRMAAAAALGKLDPMPASALAKLVSMAKTDHKYGPQLAAVRAMATAGPRAKPARAELEGLVSSQQLGLALWAKVALAAVDGDVTRSSATVQAGLANKVSAARSAAAEALLLIGPQTSDLPILLKLLKDIDSKAREGAARCIGFLGPKARDAVPALILLLSDRESEVRIAAVEALGEMGPAGLSATDKLKDLGRDVLVAPAARKTLAKLGI